MERLTAALKKWIRIALRPGAVLDPRTIRRQALPYFIGWVIILTWLYCYFLPGGKDLFTDAAPRTGFERAATYIWLFVCPLISTLTRGVRYVPKTIISVLAALSGFLCMFYLPSGNEAVLVFRIVTAVALGHIFASCGYGFFIILNNTEKFYSMIGGILVPRIILLASSLLHLKGNVLPFPDPVLLSCLLGMLACSAAFLKHPSFIPDIGRNSFPKRAWSLMAMVFAMLAFNDVIAPVLLYQIRAESRQPLEYWYFGGIVLGILLVLLLQKHFKLNICLMLNLSLALLAAGFVMELAAEKYTAAAYCCAICFGVSYAMGMVNIYYLAGFMTKRFRNITFYRVGVLLSAAFYFFGFGAVRFLENALPVLSLISVCVLILFFLLSPVFVKLLYAGEWIDDSYRPDVTSESRLRARLKERKLSPKEMEVCELLLRGCTLRQTAATMGIAYPTVNTYCTSLYRKLGINSRTELTILFRDYLEK